MTPTNAGYERMFGDGMSFGVSFPITTSDEPVVEMDAQVELARRAESLGFDALMFRDVPLYLPAFGDAGQLYDPWVYLSHVAAHTDDIALLTGSIVLPLRHPIHVAKAAASVDRLSGGRLVLGVATGDRQPEFPAFGVDQERRGELFRESVDALRTLWGEEFPTVRTSAVDLDGEMDLVPKPTDGSIPLLVTGNARQSVEWIAEHGDGWLYYTLPERTLTDVIGEWRELTDGEKPYVQTTVVNLRDDPSAGMRHVHQGYAAGSEWYVDYVESLRELGVDHLMINLRGNDDDAVTVLNRFADEVMSAFD